jgi:hypothetical protein
MTAPYIPPTTRSAPTALDVVKRMLYGDRYVPSDRPAERRADYVSPIPAWMDSLVNSPLADTLFSNSRYRTQIGTLEGVGDEERAATGTVYGTYEASDQMGDVPRGTLRMNPNREQYESSGMFSPAEVLKHEAGHAYDAAGYNNYRTEGRKLIPGGTRDFPVALYEYPDPNQVLAAKRGLYNHFNEPSPLESALEKIDLYGAAKGPREAFASAYRNAVNWLSQTARTGDTPDARALLGDYEAETPGAGNIVNRLLKDEAIYRNHPLRKSYGW